MEAKKDIENFDALERGDLSADKGKGLMASISSLDNLMGIQRTEQVSADFTQRLLAQALKVKSSASRNRIFKLLALIFVPIVLISTAVVYLSGGGSENSILVTQTLDKFYQTIQFTSDPKVQQLFLIGEGIILLVIVEKIASSYRIFRHSSHS